MSYMGARILRRVDRQGMPDLMGDPRGKALADAVYAALG